jgi:carbamoyl-phosphate synthase small subunit
MKPMYLTLEDGAVFEGRSVTQALECGGLLSFYTGVVGYQEVITDPANLGKIVLFTYPLIGNYGISAEDAESKSPKVAGVVCKEYPPYYSNFRAEGSLKDYLAAAGVAFGQGFDTRAVLLHLREHGEMKAVICGEKLAVDALEKRIAAIRPQDYKPENRPEPCENARVAASILDFGASKSFFKKMTELGIRDGVEPKDAQLIVVSDAPYFAVEDSAAAARVREWIGKKPVIGFGQGSAIVANACGAKPEWMGFGDHGVNVPVRSLSGGRNEITVQNHNYIVKPGDGIEPLFENIHDGTVEGFKCASANAAGTNFIPNEAWFEIMLNAVGVK